MTPDHMREIAGQAWDSRWGFPKDINGDGLVTISDVGGWVSWVFFAPGDFLLLATVQFTPRLAIFFEMSPAMLSGWLSGALSVILWLIALGHTYRMSASHLITGDGMPQNAQVVARSHLNQLRSLV